MKLNWVKAKILSGLDTLLISEFSVSLFELGKKVNFDFNILKQSEYNIPLSTTIKLLEDCASYVDCDYLGAMLGNAQESTTLGLLPTVGEYAETIGEAIEQIFRYQTLNTEGVEWQLTQEGELTYAILFLDSHTDTSHQQSMFLGLIQAFKLFKSISNNEWNPSRVYFSSQAPSSVKHLRSTLGNDVYFNMDFNGFIFSSSQLKAPLKARNHDVNTIIKDYMMLTGQSHKTNKLTQIKLSIRSLLLLKQSCTLPEIASSQNKTPRAIQYYLQKHKLSYQELLNEVRYDLAQELLVDSEQSIYEISALVGFTDSAIFSRSFKKYVGLTPSQYRKNS